MKQLNFKQFREQYPCYHHLSDSWLEWFIGFFEADGSFTITNTNTNTQIQFVISQYEPNIDVLIEIKDKFGFGSVVVQSPRIDRSVHKGKKHKEAIYRFVVQDLKSLHVLSTLFNNGNLILPIRNHKFKQWLNIFNQNLSNAKINRRHKFKSLSIIKYQFKETLCFKQDAWLSGFTDGDGCFSFNLLSTSNKFMLRYIIGAKNYPLFEINNLLEHINVEFFDSKGTFNEKDDFLELRVHGIKNMPIVYNYFDKYSPKCKKKLLKYLMHKIMHQKCLNKDHLDSDKRKEMDIIWKYQR